MSVSSEPVVVTHNEAESRFEVTRDGHLAVVEYQRQGKLIAFTHTGVPPALEGQGIANALAKTGLAFAREHELSVVPLCPFVASYIRRHQEYLELVHPQYRAQVASH